MLVTDCQKVYEATNGVRKAPYILTSWLKCTIPNRGFLITIIGFWDWQFFTLETVKAPIAARARLALSRTIPARGFIGMTVGFSKLSMGTQP